MTGSCTIGVSTTSGAGDGVWAWAIFWNGAMASAIAPIKYFARIIYYTIVVKELLVHELASIDNDDALVRAVYLLSAEVVPLAVAHRLLSDRHGSIDACGDA